MAHTLRLLGAAVLLAALAPLAAAQTVDCTNVPPSVGAPDPAYAACAPDTTPTEAGSGATPFFGINNSTAQFARWEGCGPFMPCASYTPPGGAFLNGGDFDGNDLTTWYGVDNAGQAIRVHTTTSCNVTQLGTMGTGWTGVTYDYTTQKFYGLQVTTCGSGSQLYELDFTTLTATPIGSTDPTNACGIALAAHPTTGTLYSYDIVNDVFLSINKTTGVSTVIGPIGFDANFGQGMDFDNENGTLFMFAFNNGTFQAELRTVNIATGNTTLVCPFGGGLQQIATASTETTVGGCDIQLLAADLSYNAGTRTLTVAVTVRNDGSSPAPARLELDYNRNGGNPQGTRVLGSGTLPAGAQVSRTINLRVPSGAPAGNYNFTLRLVDATTGTDCGQYQETIAISAPRLGDAAVGGDFDVEAVADLTPASASAGNGAAVSPNPFARQTTIHYAVEAPANVRLSVYDVLGREVAVLVEGHQEAGAHQATFDARSLAAGTYVYRLQVGNDLRTGRLTLAH